MRWQLLDVLPPLDTLVLLWMPHDMGPVLGRRSKTEDGGWEWTLNLEKTHAGTGDWVTVSSAAPIRWAVITPPILP